MAMGLKDRINREKSEPPIAEVPQKNLKIKNRLIIDMIISHEVEYETESVMQKIAIASGKGGTL